jgi:hypothetical protein
MSMYQNDRTIPNNKPGIVNCDNEKRNMYVNRCCNYRRQKVIKKDTEKSLKYKDLTTEIQRICNVRIKVIPVIRELEPFQNHSENT